MLKIKQLVFGPVIIEWDEHWEFPIALDHNHPGKFVLQCDVFYRYGVGDYFLKVPKGYSFDGASIPWMIRIVPGFEKLDWHLLAALPHDYVCDHPEILPRSVGDGIFVSVLLVLAANRAKGGGKYKKLQAKAMFVAVWSWNIATTIRHPPQVIALPPKIVASTEGAVEQAKAVSVAEEITEEDTATAPSKKN